MKPNVGTVDRYVRVLFGLGLLSLWFLLEGNMRYLALIGFVPLLTATLNFCPMYTLFGINTCGVKK
jgi:hypothetical protein